MNYKKKEFPSYNLHMIKIDKFKSVSIEVIIGRKIKKEEITISNFLSSILTYTTKKYNTKNKFARKMEELYAANVGSSCFRVGNLLNFDFSMKILSDKYSEKGLFEQSIDFLNEIIFNPNIDNNSFDLTSFNVIKHNLKSRIERLKEYKDWCSIMKSFELYDSSSPASYNMRGYIEDIEKISPSNLYEYYKEFIKNNNKDIFVVGNIDFDEVERIVSSKLLFNNTKNHNEEITINWKKHRKKIQEVFENDKTNQSKLSIVCSLEDMNDFEKRYVINLYDTILGGNADSKFFKNIREKHSICYYASTETNKIDNTMLIISGINKENYKKMISLIKKEMNDMKNGKFTEEDIENAKTYYISSVDEINDKPQSLIMTYYYIDKIKMDPPEIAKENIKKVTKEDIMKLANKVYIDTIFLLGGDKK